MFVRLNSRRGDGWFAHTDSGDIFLAFSTAKAESSGNEKTVKVEMLPIDRIDPLFEATVQATEEAIVNALVAAETMTGSTDIGSSPCPTSGCVMC
jgi:L-aminopeptidase/D-esterase-like protein